MINFNLPSGKKIDLFGDLIGGWSTNGDTIIIRDVKEFSEKVIPTAYKHNNFSSFVRQLNFCKVLWLLALL